MERKLPRAGGTRRPVLFALLLAAALFAPSCYSSNYRREMLATVSLITGLSDKLADYCRADFQVDGRAVSSEEMGEFYYALAKAQAVQRMSARSGNSQRSREQFAKLVDAYEKQVRDADRFRLSATHPADQLDALLHEHELVRQSARDVTAALAAER